MTIWYLNVTDRQKDRQTRQLWHNRALERSMIASFGKKAQNVGRTESETPVSTMTMTTPDGPLTMPT